MPSGVDANAINIGGCSFSSNSSGVLLECTTSLVVNNTTSANVSVGCYLGLDGTLIDALPILFPVGTTRQMFQSYGSGLSNGNHTLTLYACANFAGCTMVWNRLQVHVIKA